MKLFSFILLLLFAQQQTLAIKLNYPRVLLPLFRTITTNFTLEVIEGGCFKWTASRSDLITIQPLSGDEDANDDATPTDCASRARVTSLVAPEPRRRSTAIVLAEDLATGEVLRCDVILDAIHALGVSTTTRELYLEEAPEQFELWAQDAQGNEFSTLEGIAFDWQIVSGGGGGSGANEAVVLQFLRFAQSAYHEVPNAVAQFEAHPSETARGFMTLLEGVNTGSARVAVRLPYAEYAHVAAVQVDITVLANIILDPIDAHIMVGDTVAFRILQLKQGKLHEITSNTQYYLEVENTDLASIDGTQALGQRLGRTAVVLRDRNVRPTGNSHADQPIPAPRATLTICAPARIALSLLPHNNWVTVEGRRHDIAVDLYTSDNHRIHLGTKFTVQAHFDEAKFYPITRTANGSRVYGEAAEEGISDVRATFDALQATAQLEVYAELQLQPTLVVLPWTPKAIASRQQVQFRATGGDGVFTWSSHNAKLVAIAQTGLAETRLDQLAGAQLLDLQQGSSDGISAHVTKVQVALTRNPKLAQRADVVFLTPERLSIVAYNFETELDGFVDLHVALYARHNGKQIAFTACDTLHFELEFSNDIFTASVGDNNATATPLETGACQLVRLRATALGQTGLRVVYKYDTLLLADTVALVVHEPLAIFDPPHNEIVLPVGASRAVIYQHGPQPLFNIVADYAKTTDYDAATIAVSELSERGDFDSGAGAKHVFTVLCQRVGDTELLVRMHNALPSVNFRARIAEFRTRVHCVKPRFINLFTAEKLRDGCPLRLANAAMHVQRDTNDRRLEVDFEVLDVQNRRLQNTSSLQLEWHIVGGGGEGRKDESIAQHRRHAVEADIITGVPVPVRDYMVTTLPVGKTAYRIKGAVVGYDAPTLRRHGIVAERPAFGVQRTIDEAEVQPVIENELNFMAVNGTLLPYGELSIFLGHSADAVQRVPIRQGSGHYQVKLSEAGVVRAELNADASALIVTPLKLGKVSVELTDRCLATEPSLLVVSVVSIGRIEVRVADRVQKGRHIEAIVRLFDSAEQPMHLDTRNLEAYDLHVGVHTPDVADVKLAVQQTELGVGEIRYTITGVQLGEAKLVFNSGQAEKLVKSAPATIQVFPPLKLHPRNSSIIVGTKVQIHSQGGPHPDVNIVYAVENENVVAMVDTTVAHAQRLGTTAITAKCVGINPATGRQVIYSQDTVHVHVVPLERIRIQTPLTRIRAGAVMPATLWGEPGDISPMILGTLPDLTVEWTTDQPDVLRVFGVFADAGIQYGAADAIAVRVKALGTGKAKLRATVSSPAGLQTIVVEVTVFEQLELLAPQAISNDAIIVPPNFSIDLKANLADAQFAVRETGSAAGGGGVVRVSKDGTLTSGETVGRDLVIASSHDQTLAIPVEVKNIQYLLATLHTPTLKLRHAEAHIPRGTHVVLKVTLHDNLGREFAHSRLLDGGGSTLRHKLSHRELGDVHVAGNWTIGVHLPREASGMLAVSLRDTAGVKFAEDYVKLSVAQSAHIFPTKTIFSVGDIICFDSPLAYSTNWISSDAGLVHVDSSTGITRVLATRSATGDKVTIINGDRQLGHVKYDVEVREADRIAFRRGSDVFNDGETYRANLLVSNHGAQTVDVVAAAVGAEADQQQIGNVHARNASTCSQQIDELAAGAGGALFKCTLRGQGAAAGNAEQLIARIAVQPVFDRAVGAYACELRVMGGGIGGVDGGGVALELEAVLANDLAAARMQLQLVPAVQVVPRTLQPLQLATAGEVITVRGADNVLQKLEVKSSNESILEVLLIAKSTGVWQFRARLLQPIPVVDGDGNAGGTSLAVLVTSAQSHQRIRVPVLVASDASLLADGGGGQCGSQPLYTTTGVLVSVVSNMGLIISVLIALAVVISAFVYCFPPKAPAAASFDEGLSPFKNANRSNNTSIGSAAGSGSPLQNTLYPLSPAAGGPYSSGGSPHSASTSSPSMSPLGGRHIADESSPIYGHSSPISPGKRLNRRYL